MLRISAVAALVVWSTSASAQFMEPIKGVKFGEGCIGPVSTYAVRLGACAIADTRSRIWCPNGQVFDRNGSAYEVFPRHMWLGPFAA
jgi:hypothetical protein